MRKKNFDRLLAGVSRSFYLSLRLLPGGMRASVGLGYLLARATDTLADSGEASPEERVRAIRAVLAAMGEEGAPAALDCAWLTPEKPAERALLAELPDLLARYRESPPPDRADLFSVIREIAGGQIGDLTRDGPVRSAEELDRYTYQVAGCVGRFWTRVGARATRAFAGRPPEEMEAVGVRYGKGLQLVNILRDLPSDLAAGRQYLPELTSPCWSEWKGRCLAGLRAGAEYSAALGRGRVRYASFLPWYLGAATAALLPDDLPAPGASPAKIGRPAVARALRAGLLAAASDGWHRRLAAGAFAAAGGPPESSA